MISVQHPEGATDDEILAYAKANWVAAPPGEPITAHKFDTNLTVAQANALPPEKSERLVRQAGQPYSTGTDEVAQPGTPEAEARHAEALKRIDAAKKATADRTAFLLNQAANDASTPEGPFLGTPESDKAEAVKQVQHIQAQAAGAPAEMPGQYTGAALRDLATGTGENLAGAAIPMAGLAELALAPGAVIEALRNKPGAATAAMEKVRRDVESAPEVPKAAYALVEKQFPYEVPLEPKGLGPKVVGSVAHFLPALPTFFMGGEAAATTEIEQAATAALTKIAPKFAADVAGKALQESAAFMAAGALQGKSPLEIARMGRDGLAFGVGGKVSDVAVREIAERLPLNQIAKNLVKHVAHASGAGVTMTGLSGNMTAAQFAHDQLFAHALGAPELMNLGRPATPDEVRRTYERLTKKMTPVDIAAVESRMREATAARLRSELPPESQVKYEAATEGVRPTSEIFGKMMRKQGELMAAQAAPPSPSTETPLRPPEEPALPDEQDLLNRAAQGDAKAMQDLGYLRAEKDRREEQSRGLAPGEIERRREERRKFADTLSAEEMTHIILQDQDRKRDVEETVQRLRAEGKSDKEIAGSPAMFALTQLRRGGRDAEVRANLVASVERQEAPAKFLGTQEGYKNAPAVDLYNLTSDIPGHPKDSTVSADTLLKAGFALPKGPNETRTTARTAAERPGTQEAIRGSKGNVTVPIDDRVRALVQAMPTRARESTGRMLDSGRLRVVPFDDPSEVPEADREALKDNVGMHINEGGKSTIYLHTRSSTPIQSTLHHEMVHAAIDELAPHAVNAGLEHVTRDGRAMLDDASNQMGASKDFIQALPDVLARAAKSGNLDDVIYRVAQHTEDLLKLGPAYGLPAGVDSAQYLLMAAMREAMVRGGVGIPEVYDTEEPLAYLAGADPKFFDEIMHNVGHEARAGAGERVLARLGTKDEDLLEEGKPAKIREKYYTAKKNEKSLPRPWQRLQKFKTEAMRGVDTLRMLASHRDEEFKGTPDEAKKLLVDTWLPALRDRMKLGPEKSGLSWYGDWGKVIKDDRDTYQAKANEATDRLHAMAMAITSNSTEVEINFNSGMHAFDSFMEDGEFPMMGPRTGDSFAVKPSRWGWGGTADGTIAQHMKRLNGVLDIMGGPEPAAEWLFSKHPLGKRDEEGSLRWMEAELKRKGVWGQSNDPSKPSGMSPGQVLELDGGDQYGSLIFGPKVGRFAQNLHGNREVTTLDRFIARVHTVTTGKKDFQVRINDVGIQEPDIDVSPDMRVALDGAIREMARRLKITPADTQAMLWFQFKELLAHGGGNPVKRFTYGDAIEKTKATAGQGALEFGPTGAEAPGEGALRADAGGRVRADALKALVAHTFDQGGGTFDRETLAPVVRDTGFQVGIDPAFYDVEPMNLKDATPARVEEALKSMPPGAEHVGTWIENGKIDFEPSFFVADKEEALRQAKETNQKAIGDWENKTTIPTGGTGRRVMKRIGQQRNVAQNMVGAAQGIRHALNPLSVGPGARETGRDLRAALGEMARNNVVAEKALRSAKKYWDKRPEAEQLDFYDRMERGLPQANRDHDKMAMVLRRELDNGRKAIQALGTGKLQQFLVNYMPHIWKDKVKAGEFYGRRPLPGTTGYLKKRTIPTQADGIAQGLEPEFPNPVDGALARIHQMNKYVMAHRVALDLEARGLVQNVPSNGFVPTGWTRLMDSTFANKMMPSDAAHVINNYLSPGLVGKPGYDLVRQIGNVMNQAQLGLSAYHATFTMVDAATSTTALGLKQIASGKPLQGVLTTARGLTLLPAYAKILHQGNKVLKEYERPGTQGGDIAKIVEHLQQAGGRARMDQFYETNMADRFMTTLRQIRGGNLKATGGLWRAPLALLDVLAAPIMKSLVPRMKLGMFTDLARYELDRLGPRATHEDKVAAMQRAWDSVDNRMGQMVYDNLFWNRMGKDLAMISVRSVGWNVGTLRELGGAGVDIASLPARIARGEAARRARGEQVLTHRMAYAIALPLQTALIGGLMYYMYNRKPPEKLEDYFHVPTGETDPRTGLPIKKEIASYMKDVFAYGGTRWIGGTAEPHPIQTIMNKIHPFASATYQMVNNQDYYGDKIWNEGDSFLQRTGDKLKFAGKQLLPFSVTNLTNQTGAQGLGDLVEKIKSEPESLLSAVGITPVKTEFQRTRAENLMRDVLYNQMPREARTKEAAQAGRDEVRAIRSWKQGDHQPLLSYIKDKDLSGPEIDALFQTVTGQGSIVDKFKKIQDTEQAFRVWRVATPEERKKLRVPFIQKIIRQMELHPSKGKIFMKAARDQGVLGEDLPTEALVPQEESTNE